ncbi:hypothetical protein HT031_001761 [Scenedesmus sp. PABB004]|nr:hypothetical protein HT031_001761 [Scenedesmus sp. PABB004]
MSASGYGSFYANVCRLLSSINSGLVHRRPSVKLPLSKVGLELSALLANLGVICDFSVAQAGHRLKGHARQWRPPALGGGGASGGGGDAPAHTALAAGAAGHPGMYLTVHLNWDAHRPLYAPSALAAAPGARGGAAARPPAGFAAPLGINARVPEHVKLISRPSAQRWVGLDELRRRRAAAPPGIYLLSTHEASPAPRAAPRCRRPRAVSPARRTRAPRRAAHPARRTHAARRAQGLMTDIDAELRGLGGILLAHLGLPLGHVTALRGLLRAKYAAERAAGSGGGGGGGGAHALPSQWDARAAAGAAVAARLAGGNAAAAQRYLDEVEAADAARLEASGAAGARLEQLRLQQLVWQQHGGTAQQEQAQRGGGGREQQAQRGGGRRAGGGGGRGRR